MLELNMSTTHEYRQVIKNGTQMPISEALSRSFIDVNGNEIAFQGELPKFYIENNGYAYSINGLKEAMITISIEKIPEKSQPIEKQEKEKGTLQSTTKITSKSKAK